MTLHVGQAMLSSHWQVLICRKYGLPAIFLPHLQALTTKACFRARGTLVALVADGETPYSLDQPLCRGRIDQGDADLVAVLLAELLKRPVGNKGIGELQFASRQSDPELSLYRLPNRSATFSHENRVILAQRDRDSRQMDGSQVSLFFSQ